MKVTFLGTSAAPSMPIPFCTCSVCSLARRTRGKNLRRRSSILVNSDLLVDIGPDTATASFEYSISLTGVSICLLTHPHEDHVDPEFIMCRHPEYGTVVPHDLLIAGSAETLKAVDAILSRRCAYGSIFDQDTQSALRLQSLSLIPFEPVRLGNYRVTPYPANHGFVQRPLVYVIEQGRQAIFYCTDTSVLSDAVWDHLLTHGTRFDAVILDHTYGIGYSSTPDGHLASQDVATYADRFRAEGLLEDDGAVYATHISHEGCLEHDEFDAYARGHGYRVAFDGMILELGGQPA